jgi:hypothetical protein
MLRTLRLLVACLALGVLVAPALAPACTDVVS